MADHPKTPRSWSRPSGTVMADCPRCVEANELEIDPRKGNPECKVCEGDGEVGLAHAVAWILAHGKTDPAPPDPDTDPDAETKPERP